MKEKLFKLLILVGVVLQLFVGCNILGLDDDDDEAIKTSADSTLFMLSSTGKYISAFNYISGVEIKQNFVQLESESVASDFCVWEDKILVAATAYSALNIYSADDGKLIKQVPLGDGVKPAFVIASGGVAYITASQGANKLHKVDLTDYTLTSVAGGECLQNIYYNDEDGSLYVSDIEDLYSPAGKLLVINPENLTVIKSYDDVSQNPQDIICDNGSIYVACGGQSWSGVNGAIDKFAIDGTRTASPLIGKYPSRLVRYKGNIYATAGYDINGLFSVQDTSDVLVAKDYSVAAVVAKGDYLVTTQSNWTSSDSKAHLYIYQSGVLKSEFQVGDSPSCVRFYKK